MISRDLILATLEEFTNGHLVHTADEVIALGYPAEFVEPLAENPAYAPDGPHQTPPNTRAGKRLGLPRGVHDLDILAALAEAIRADTSGVKAFGRRARARQYAEAIREALHW